MDSQYISVGVGCSTEKNATQWRGFHPGRGGFLASEVSSNILSFSICESSILLSLICRPDVRGRIPVIFPPHQHASTPTDKRSNIFRCLFHSAPEIMRCNKDWAHGPVRLQCSCSFHHYRAELWNPANHCLRCYPIFPQLVSIFPPKSSSVETLQFYKLAIRPSAHIL